MTLSLAAPILALALAAVGTGFRQQAATPKVSSVEAVNYVGRTATVCGKIVSIACRADDSRVWFTLDGPYPRGARIAITAIDRPALGSRIGPFLLQQVCATGTIDKDPTGRFHLEQSRPASRPRTAPPNPASVQRAVHDVRCRRDRGHRARSGRTDLYR